MIQLLAKYFHFHSSFYISAIPFFDSFCSLLSLLMSKGTRTVSRQRLYWRHNSIPKTSELIDFLENSYACHAITCYSTVVLSNSQPLILQICGRVNFCGEDISPFKARPWNFEGCPKSLYNILYSVKMPTQNIQLWLTLFKITLRLTENRT